MKHLQLLFLLLFATLFTFGQNFPEPMNPKRMVNDFTNMFNAQEQTALEQKLQQFNEKTSTQIAIATIPTLDGYNANDYAQRLAEKWGIGQKGKDNGILIVVKPKNGREKGEVAIAVGYGLEGAVPDAIASRIIRNEVIPAFQAGQYYTGLDKATTVLADLTKGEYTAEQYAKKKSQKGGLLPILIPLAIFIFLPMFIRRRHGYTTGSAATTAAPFFIGGILGGGSSRGFGSFSSGGGSFGGFGGGSFGGGGASGSW